MYGKCSGRGVGLVGEGLGQGNSPVQGGKGTRWPPKPPIQGILTLDPGSRSRVGGAVVGTVLGPAPHSSLDSSSQLLALCGKNRVGCRSRPYTPVWGMHGLAQSSVPHPQLLMSAAPHGSPSVLAPPGWCPAVASSCAVPRPWH